MDETIRERDPRLQDVAVALLRMDPANRQLFIYPLIVLIMRVAATGSGSSSAPGTPADEDLDPHSRTLPIAPYAAESAQM